MSEWETIDDEGWETITPETPPERGPLEVAGEFAGGFSSVVPSLLGAPVDIANWLARKVDPEGADLPGGARDIRGLLSPALYGVDIETGEPAPTYAGKTGEFTGLGLGMLAPVIQAGKATALPKTAEAIRHGVPATTTLPRTAEALKYAPAPTGGIMKGMAETIAKPFAASPKRAMAGELVTSGLAGAGSVFGEKLGGEYGFPQTGEMVGAITGGLAPAGYFAAGSAARKPIVDFFSKHLAPSTERGGKIIAEKRVQSLAESAEAAATELAKADVLPGVPLSAAKKSADDHLIALDKLVRSKDPKLDRIGKQDTALVNQMAREEAEKLAGGGSITDTQKIVGKNIAISKAKIEDDLRIHMSLAQAKASKLTPDTPREVASQIVRDELDNGLARARAHESEMWGKIPKDVDAPVVNTLVNYNNMLVSRAYTADPADIPKYVRTFLGDIDDAGNFTIGTLDKRHTVGEVDQFRKRLGADAAKARANSEWNKARILEDIKNDLLADVSNVARKEVQQAIGVSRALNDTYTKGTVGKLLGYDKAGGLKTPAALTLETGVPAGLKGAEGAKDIIKAGGDATPQAIQEHLLSRIQTSSVINKEGMVNPQQAEQFLLKNQELMDQFPDVRRMIEDGIEASKQYATSLSRSKIESSALDKSLQGKLVAAEPHAAMNMLFREPDAAGAMRTLWKEADDAGKAGLKNDVIHHMLAQADTGGKDAVGKAVKSGTTLRHFYAENADTLGVVLSKPEMRRLNTIITTLERNQPTNIPGIGTSISAHKPSKYIDYPLTVVAARWGALMGAGSGATLKTASAASAQARDQLQNLSTGKATDMLVAAIKDEKLLSALLTSNTAPLPRQRRANKIIVGWIAGTLETKGDDIPKITIRK